MVYKEGIIVCEKGLRNQILKELVGIKDYKFKSLSEFTEELTITIKKEGIIFISKKYNISPSITKDYFSYLKYLNNINKKDKVIDNERINNLLNIYHDLKESNYIEDNNNAFYYQNKNITFLGYEESELTFICNILNNVNINYEIIPNKKNNYIKREVYEFERLEDESRFVFNKIKRLLDENVDISKIKICNYTNDYDFCFKRLESYYQIPINFESKKNILSTSICHRLFDLLNTCDTINDCISILKKEYEMSLYYKKIINIINAYNLKNYHPSDYVVKDIFKMEFSNLPFEKVTYENGIDLVNLYNYDFKEDEYVFYIGFNISTSPKIIIDKKYLSDEIITNNSDLLLETTVSQNRRNKNKNINFLNTKTNLTISYAKRSSMSSYLSSTLIDELDYTIINPLNSTCSNLNAKGKRVITYDTKYKQYLFGINEKEDKLIFGEHLDDYRKFNEEKDEFFKRIYKMDYLTYDNRYTGINKDLLEKHLPQCIKLSYSSLKYFYECKFKYYLDSILRVGSTEDQYYANIGKYAHEILEHSYDKDFNFEDSCNNAVYNVYGDNATYRELFFLSLLNKLLVEMISFNELREKNNSLPKVLTEKKDQISFYDGKLIFKGTIDKTLYNNELLLNDEEADSYICIIDYKSGKDSIDLKNIEYGFNAQLPLYIYLVKHGEIFNSLFNKPKILGFYLQRINLETRDFRLEGYSTNERSLLEVIDNQVGDKEYLKNIAFNNNGSFNAHSKIFTDEDMKRYIDTAEKLIIEGYKAIREGSFEINPKRQNGKILSCTYCQYNNVCYKRYENYVDLPNLSDDSKKKEEKKDGLE